MHVERAKKRAIVFARYTFLEWLRRQENDPKTYGGLFFALCEDVQDMEH